MAGVSHPSSACAATKAAGTDTLPVAALCPPGAVECQQGPGCFIWALKQEDDCGLLIQNSTHWEHRAGWRGQIPRAATSEGNLQQVPGRALRGQELPTGSPWGQPEHPKGCWSSSWGSYQAPSRSSRFLFRAVCGRGKRGPVLQGPGLFSGYFQAIFVALSSPLLSSISSPP